MVANPVTQTSLPLSYLDRLMAGVPLLPDSPANTEEVVGILKSYGVVLDAYSKNLIYIANEQFLVLFPFFKYLDGDRSLAKLLKHWWHDRINFEYAEYCMRAMMWHGGGGMDAYLDTPEFARWAGQAIAAKTRGNLFVHSLNWASREFLNEQVRQLAYYSALGQFWRVMSDMFIDLSDKYDRGEIPHIPAVVDHVQVGLVAAAGLPITYGVNIRGQYYPILPPEANLTFLMDVAVPYVEAVFFRGTPFPGTVSFNAQAHQIPMDQAAFAYGALYADPVPIGGSGIPPTQLMQDMRHYIPDYLMARYQKGARGEVDLRVKICQSFQKSMFCVTSAAIFGLAPHSLDTQDPQEHAANQAYFSGWLDRFVVSRLEQVNTPQTVI
jgi:CO2 hydration protein